MAAELLVLMAWWTSSFLWGVFIAYLSGSFQHQLVQVTIELLGEWRHAGSLRRVPSPWRFGLGIASRVPLDRSRGQRETVQEMPD
jgi:hypothetical protein